MRIVVHDYSGHPFQVQLSRALAARGHAVLHVYSASFPTPKGELTRRPADPPGLAFKPIAVAGAFRKDAFLRRRAQEAETGRLVADAVAGFAPDVVISGNAPLDAQTAIQAATRRSGAKFVFWLQDIYSEAIRQVLSRKLPGLGHLVAAYYQRLEYRLLRDSDAVIAITEDFLAPLARHGVAAGNITVIENWAPLDAIAPLPRDNPWALTHMPHAGLRVVYAGTLGHKHDASLLLAIARTIAGHLYVFSEGLAAEALARQAVAAGVGNLSVAGWVPFAELAQMLAGADLLVALLERGAGRYSVPSKVLTYLCAGRPIAAAIPEGNLAGKIIRREHAGVVCAPGDTAALLRQVGALAGDAERRQQLGANARNYAERAFEIERIADRFEAVLAGLA